MKLDNEERTIDAVWVFLQLPKKFVDTFRAGISTPDVSNREYWRGPSGATVITNFLKGGDCQRLHILGNGNMTVNNTTTIKTNTGANKLLANNKVYRFTLFDGIWYEDA